MSWTVSAAILGWIPTTLALFAWLPSRRAALASLMLGYLLLPQAMLQYSPFLSKGTIPSIAVLLGITLFDVQSLLSLRLRWYDSFVVIWCLCPLGSSLSNGLGAYDGLFTVAGATLQFGVPYLVGRLYFARSDLLRELTIGIVAGGLLYVPLCWYEIVMSPQIHSIVYGFHQHMFAQTRRLGGWRPVVFLQHGLAVGMWMVAASVAATTLWRARRLPRFPGAAPAVTALTLGATAVLCKSLGAILLMVLGSAVALTSVRTRTTILVAGLILLAPVYLLLRLTTDWGLESVVETTRELEKDRAYSLQARLKSDLMLRDHAMERPWFGWGGWNRLRLGMSQLTPDSLWAIILAQRGLVGLSSYFAILALMPMLALSRIRSRPGDAAMLPDVTALIVILTLYTFDCLMNAMVNPVFMIVAGAIGRWGGERTVAHVGRPIGRQPLARS